MEHKRAVGSQLDPKTKKILNVMLLAIILYASVYCIVFANGPSYLGDDIAYSWLAHQAAQGRFVQMPGDVLSIRILQIYPIALFYWAFGVGLLSSSAWDVISFVATIAIVFYIGRELYNEYAGLLAAFIFAFFPTVVRLSVTMSDNPPMMFLVSLAMLALLYGQSKRSRNWYLVSGISLAASCLVMPEGLMAVGIVLLYLVAKAVKDKFKIDKNEFYILYGAIVVMLLLMAFNYANTGNPLITLQSSFSFYQTGAAHFVPENANLIFYPSVMFPYNVVRTVSGDLARLNLNPVSIWRQIYIVNYNTVGFYFYFAVLAIAYLLYKRESKSYFALFWLVVGFMIMEFDPFHVSLSPFSYQLQHRLDRYLTLIAPPAALLISIAAVRIVEGARSGWAKHRTQSIATISIVALAILFLVTTAIPVNALWNRIELEERYSQVQIADYLNALPNTTIIYYTSGDAIPIYMHFDNLSRFRVYDQISDCRNISGNSFIALPEYIRIYNLSYTPAINNTCAYWEQITLHQPPNASQAVSEASMPAEAELFYVPKNSTG